MAYYWVVETQSREWGIRKEGAGRYSEVHPTQAEAIARGRELVRNSGGGEIIIQGRDGQIRQRDTVPPGNDPYPPAG